MLNAMEDQTKKLQRVARNSVDNIKSLKLVEVSVYNLVMRDLFDSVAVSSVMSARLCGELHLQRKDTNRKVQMADSSEAGVLEELNNDLITVGDMT